MHPKFYLAAALAGSWQAAASSILFTGGTIVAFDRKSGGLNVIRNGSVLVENDVIKTVSAGGIPVPKGNGVETVDITGKIITPGFVNTHMHLWQTAFKTLASNTSLVEYFSRYGEFAAASLLSVDDVYIGQLAGILESLNGGVTTILDHSHHTWSNATSLAGLQASIDSGGRIFWSYAFHNITRNGTNYQIPEQLANFRDLATKAPFKGSPTTLGVAYDSFSGNPNTAEIRNVIDTAKKYNASVITTHALGGPWGISNMPEDLAGLGILNISIPIVFSHASFLNDTGAALLRESNHYVSTTPESEYHYGHTHPRIHLYQDQISLGVDTHFTFSADILTQARLWLQPVRRLLYAEVLSRNEVPSHNPMSANQAFLLATRHGGLALRREDIGVIEEGAKADLVVWDGTSPSLLGWNDPVAAVILHASIADVEHVLVDGKWMKKGFKLTQKTYPEIKKRFLASASRIQRDLINLKSEFPQPGDTWQFSGLKVADPTQVDTLRGPGTGYGVPFLKA